MMSDLSTSTTNSTASSSTQLNPIRRKISNVKMGNLFFKQTSILLWKSLIVRKVHYISTFFEIFAPILLIWLIVWICSKSKISSPNNHNNYETNHSNQSVFKGPIYFRKPYFTIDFKSHQNDITWNVQKVYFAPKNRDTINLGNSLVKWNYAVDGYDNETILQQEITRNIGEFPPFYIPIIGIIFENIDLKNGKIKYKILLPTRAVKEEFDAFKIKFTQEPRYDIPTFDIPISPIISYLNFQFVDLFTSQNSIESFKLFKTLDQIRMNRMPYPKYRNPDFTQFSIYDMLACYILLIYTIICPLIVKRITDEKSTKCKEMLRMIGMSDLVFWASHFINNFLIVLIHAGVFTIFFFCYPNPLFIYSQPIICLLVLIMFGIQMILFAMLITTIFNRPVLAVIITLLIWICTSAVFAPMLQTMGSSTMGNNAYMSRVGASFLPTGSLLWFITIMGTWENLSVGSKFSNLNTRTILYGDFTLMIAIILVFFSYFLYAFLIWYLDNVSPFQHGVPKSPFYILKKDYWFPHKKFSDTDEQNGPKYDTKIFEPNPSNLEPTIEIKNVTKVFNKASFNKKIAVKDLWLNIYKHQLTVLLGHNGAGKSTLMNMITGLFGSTSGRIYVDGFNVFTQTKEARSSIGLCPQENILFNELTVFQHLKLFAILKNWDVSKVNQEVTRILELLQLAEKKHALAINLSGGMKRKLQLGMAMIGDTDILILDEPTSGLDPEARRAVWDMLIAMRREKTILLTTHYMEEADVLGDRIAIMSEGKLCCSGSPFFLKSVFGDGYQLRIEKLPHFDPVQFLRLLQRYISTATLRSHTETEIIFVFNQKSDEKKQLISVLPHLFKNIEENREKYGINSFGLSYSTLEDVFLSVDSPEILVNQLKNEEREVSENVTNTVQQNIKLTERSDLTTGYPLKFNQFCALIVKRFNYGWRYWKMLILQLIIPSSIIALAMILSNNSIRQIDSSNDPIELNVEKIYGTETQAYYEGPENLYNFYKEINGKYQANVVYVDKLNDNFTNEILKQSLDEYTKKVIYGLQMPHSSSPNVIDLWFNGEPTFSVFLSIKTFFETVLQSINLTDADTSIDIKLQPMIIKDKASHDLDFNFILQSWVVTCLILLPIAFPFLAASYALYPIKERTSKSKHIQLMTGVSPTLFWFCNFVFDLIYHLISICIIFLIIYFFDFNNLFFGGETQSTAAVLFTILFAFGFGTIPFSYLFSHLFNVPSSGFTYLVIIFLALGLFANLAMSLLDLLFTISPQSELAGSLAFTKYLIFIFRFIPIFSMLFGYQKIFKANSFMKICNATDLEIICSQKPEGLFKGCCKEICEKDNSCYDIGSFSFGPFGSGYEILFLFISGILYMFIIILLQANQHRFQILFHRLFRRERKTEPSYQRVGFKLEDNDVATERTRIENLIEEDTNRRFMHDLILVHDLTKYFGAFKAVDHLSFGVKSDECFGLLGINGAGKTTTFSMLTGDLFQSDGDAFMEGNISLTKNLRKFQRNIGYCPQFDALLDNLTGEEHLYLIGSLRGVPHQNLSNDVQSLIRMVDLQAHAKKVTSTYSGGNKRKLSIALSLIGNPRVLFLDEPTSGVDPSARRKVWKTLGLIKSTFDSAIILTSHSMEECEALCSRIAIMVSGKFRCLGSTQHLRSKYGQGYKIQARIERRHELDEEYNQRLKNKLVELIPSAKLNDYHQCLMSFHVQDSSVKWSTLFEKMAEIDQLFVLEDYVISDTTLESIFLLFARNQQNNSCVNS